MFENCLSVTHIIPTLPCSGRNDFTRLMCASAFSMLAQWRMYIEKRSCLCYRKGNEFWANHNKCLTICVINGVVFVTAKVMNFEQITTPFLLTRYTFGCLCYRKGNEFWANHNQKRRRYRRREVVFVTAKVMNFEQITTATYCSTLFSKLSLLPQR